MPCASNPVTPTLEQAAEQMFCGFFVVPVAHVSEPFAQKKVSHPLGAGNLQVIS